MSADEKLKLIVEQMTCKHLNRLQAQVLNDTKMPERVANKIMQAEGLRERK